MANFIIKYALCSCNVPNKNKEYSQCLSNYSIRFLEVPKSELPPKHGVLSSNKRLAHTHIQSSVFSVRPLTFIFWLASVRFTGEERLMILGRQIHVIVSEGFLALGPGEALVLRPPEQIKGVSPNLTF